MASRVLSSVFLCPFRSFCLVYLHSLIRATPIPVHMSGEVISAPNLIRWPDIENLQRYPDIFYDGEPVSVTEKIHGTCCLLTLDVEAGELHVSSKGFGGRSQSLVPADDNLYWRAVRAHQVGPWAAQVGRALQASRVAVFGEVYGAGVQDLGYGADASIVPGYAAFDVAWSDESGKVAWLDPTQFYHCQTLIGPMPTAPVLYEGPYDEVVIRSLANGRETVSGTSANIREGVVVRSAVNRYSLIIGSRAIGKFVSGDYLTRKGGTEYE